MAEKHSSCAVKSIVSIDTVILLAAAGAGAAIWSDNPSIGAVGGGLIGLFIAKVI